MLNWLGVLLWSDGDIWNWIEVVVGQHHEYTQCHGAVHFTG